jgi:uncharacterized SAM-binding protein YcdF (DUF218 family)
MTRGHIKKMLFLATNVFLVCLGSYLLLTTESSPGYNSLQSVLNKKLIMIEPLPLDCNDLHSKDKNIIYVMGGSQDHLEHRFKTAADFYHRKIATKILVLSRPGITEYDPTLNRNLTNDEWAIKKLEDLGVKKEDIEPVPLEKAFFGTLSEARGISQLVSKRGYNCLVLITSPYHTRRVWASFTKFLKDKGITYHVYQSDDCTDSMNLLLEYLKLIVYRDFLL